DSLLARVAVADDADPVDSKQGCAAVRTVVVAIDQRLQSFLGFCSFLDERAEELLTGHLHDKIKDPLADLENDIADKAICDNDVAGSFVDITALDVADELLAKVAVLEKRLRFFGKVVPLLFFRADVH